MEQVRAMVANWLRNLAELVDPGRPVRSRDTGANSPREIAEVTNSAAEVQGVAVAISMRAAEFRARFPDPLQELVTRVRATGQKVKAAA